MNTNETAYKTLVSVYGLLVIGMYLIVIALMMG